MSSVTELQSGKDHTGENFPVASFLIAPRHRPPVLAFYKFVRTADDVADSATATPDEKLALLEQMRASLMGESDVVAEGVKLRQVLAAHGLSSVHALDLLEAFRRDCTKLRYRDWDDLIDYCRYSAMPVGRFVLDVHGEPQNLWPANDALCAALQVINHLQDCAKDYRELDRVYIPEPLLTDAGISVAALGEDKANPALAGVIRDLARRNAGLLDVSRPFARGIKDGRLALEVDLIQTLADDLNTMLMNRDPLSQAVHHSKMDVAALFLKRFPAFALMRLTRQRSLKRSSQRHA
jgi:squalene synthase HpnC